MARLRMDGVTSDASVPTPPAGKATIFYNSVDRVYKVKLDDGSVAPIGSGGGGAVSSVNGQTGAVVLTKSDIGLGNVDNTSDLNKPISTATQTALNAQELRISTAEGDIDTLQIDVGALQSGLSDLGGRVFTVEGEVVALDSAVSGLDTRVTAAEGSIGTLQTDVSTLQGSVGTLQTDVGTLQTDVGALQTSVGTLQTDVGSLQTSVGTLQTDVGTLQTDVSSIQTEIGTIEGAISNLETAVAAKYDASNPANYVDAAGAAAAAPVQSVAGKTGDVTIDLSTDVTGALPVSLGGSGRTDFPAMQLLFGAPDALSIDRSEFLTYDASIGLLINQGGQMQTRSLEQNPTDPSAVVIYDKVEVTGDDGTGPAYSRLKRDYIEARKVLPTKELSASAGFDGVDSWLGVSETTNEGNNISMAKIFPNKAQLFTVDIGLGNGPQPILPVESYDLTTKQYVDNQVAGIVVPVESVAGKTGAVVLDKSDIGLGNVDNTSDLNKPISTATATALSGKLSLSGGTMSGAINMGSNLINSVTDPVSAQDAATKNYVDTGLAVSQVRYVSKNGNDSTGNGSINKPFLTIAAAMNSITDSSPTNRYAIFVASGNYTETGVFYIKPNVFVCGLAKESVRISATSFQMHSTFNANSSFDNRSGFYRVSLLNACDFNWNTVQSAAGKLYFNEVSFSSTVNLYGYNNAIAQAQFDSCLLFGALTVSGINVGVFTNNICYSNITLTQHPNGGMATILNAAGGYCAGTYSATTTVTDFNRRCAGFARSFYMGTVTLNGASVYLDYTVDSLPAAGATITNGANLVAMNAGGGANTALSNLVYPTAVNNPIMPASTGITNLGDWGKQWAWHFAYVHASSGSDCYLISYPSSYGADSSGKNIGIYPDGAGLQSNVNGGQIDMETAAVSGTGVRGNIRMSARNIDHTQSPSVNFVIENGATGSRPAAPVVGQMYFDTTLKKPIWYSSTGWVDSAGTAV